jgi:HK97 gp10 family phage protein
LATEIQGVGALRDAFNQLGIDIQTKAAPRIAAAGGAVLRKEARVIAEAAGLRKTGALIANIVIKKERNAPAGTVQYNLGVRHGRDLGNGKKVIKYLAIGKSGRVVTRRKDDPFYWHFLEFGTKYIKATHFIQRALENKAQEAVDAMTAKAQKEILKANK